MSAPAATINPMSSFSRKYSPAQREAVIAAYRPGVVTAAHVSKLAAAGELVAVDDQRLDPFAVPANTIRDMRRKDDRARRGALVSPLLGEHHRDAVEQLRRRMVNAADAALAAEEARPVEERSPERLRQVARLVREIASLPARDEPAPPAPGVRRDGVRVGGATRGGLAGQILADHRATATGGR